MKKIITLCLMLVMANMAMGQAASSKGTPNEEKAERLSTKWATSLSLTDAQKTAAYDIVLAKMTKRDAILAKYTGKADDAAKQTELTALRNEIKAEMKTLLGTSGQKYQRWEVMFESDNSK
ncbi:MAG TPA: hypothetical protein VD905_01845 [Flavobacteriales bacterium]|nr:hypothetical protein [Flavobacteriales bacterium]